MNPKTFANGVGGMCLHGDFPALKVFVHSEGVLQNEAFSVIPQAFSWSQLGNISRLSKTRLMPEYEKPIQPTKASL